MAEDTQALTLSETEMQLVVFDLASEYYGVDIGAVREIIRMQSITRVPGAESFVEGLINLRGRVVPVVDLRKRLNLAVGEQTKDSRIVVVDIAGQDVGVVVDGVTEVLRIPLSSIEPPASMVTSVESDYLRGIAKLDTKLIILLDLDKVFSAIERQAISGIGVVAEEPPSTAEVEEKTNPVSDRGKKKKKALVASIH